MYVLYITGCIKIWYDKLPSHYENVGIYAYTINYLI